MVESLGWCFDGAALSNFFSSSCNPAFTTLVPGNSTPLFSLLSTSFLSSCPWRTNIERPYTSLLNLWGWNVGIKLLMSILPFADLVTDNLDGIPSLSGNLLFHVFLPCQDHLFLVFPGETLVSVLKMLIKLTVIDNKKMVNSNLFMSSNLGRSTSFCPVSHPDLPTNTSKLQSKKLSFNIWKAQKVAIYLADQKLPMSRPVTKVGDRNMNSASICWGLACPAAKGIVGWIYNHLQNVLFTWAK